jgi:hypothetical protein
MSTDGNAMVLKLSKPGMKLPPNVDAIHPPDRFASRFAWDTQAYSVIYSNSRGSVDGSTKGSRLVGVRSMLERNFAHAKVRRTLPALCRALEERRRKCMPRDTAKKLPGTDGTTALQVLDLEDETLRCAALSTVEQAAFKPTGSFQRHQLKSNERGAVEVCDEDDPELEEGDDDVSGTPTAQFNLNDITSSRNRGSTPVSTAPTTPTTPKTRVYAPASAAVESTSRRAHAAANKASQAEERAHRSLERAEVAAEAKETREQKKAQKEQARRIAKQQRLFAKNIIGMPGSQSIQRDACTPTASIAQVAPPTCVPVGVYGTTNRAPDKPADSVLGHVSAGDKTAGIIATQLLLPAYVRESQAKADRARAFSDKLELEAVELSKMLSGFHNQKNGAPLTPPSPENKPEKVKGSDDCHEKQTEAGMAPSEKHSQPPPCRVDGHTSTRDQARRAAVEARQAEVLAANTRAQATKEAADAAAEAVRDVAVGRERLSADLLRLENADVFARSLETVFSDIMQQQPGEKATPQERQHLAQRKSSAANELRKAEEDVSTTRDTVASDRLALATQRAVAAKAEVRVQALLQNERNNIVVHQLPDGSNENAARVQWVRITRSVRKLRGAVRRHTDALSGRERAATEAQQKLNSYRATLRSRTQVEDAADLQARETVGAALIGARVGVSPGVAVSVTQRAMRVSATMHKELTYVQRRSAKRDQREESLLEQREASLSQALLRVKNQEIALTNAIETLQIQEQVVSAAGREKVLSVDATEALLATSRKSKPNVNPTPPKLKAPPASSKPHFRAAPTRRTAYRGIGHARLVDHHFTYLTNAHIPEGRMDVYFEEENTPALRQHRKGVLKALYPERPDWCRQLDTASVHPLTWKVSTFLLRRGYLPVKGNVACSFPRLGLATAVDAVWRHGKSNRLLLIELKKWEKVSFHATRGRLRAPLETISHSPYWLSQLQLLLTLLLFYHTFDTSQFAVDAVILRVDHNGVDVHILEPRLQHYLPKLLAYCQTNFAHQRHNVAEHEATTFNPNNRSKPRTQFEFSGRIEAKRKCGFDDEATKRFWQPGLPPHPQKRTRHTKTPTQTRTELIKCAED